MALTAAFTPLPPPSSSRRRSHRRDPARAASSPWSGDLRSGASVGLEDPAPSSDGAPDRGDGHNRPTPRRSSRAAGPPGAGPTPGHSAPHSGPPRQAPRHRRHRRRREPEALAYADAGGRAQYRRAYRARSLPSWQRRLASAPSAPSKSLVWSVVSPTASSLIS